mgnify:CR=1 FL=1
MITARLGSRLLNVLGLAMLLPALAWSGTFSIPETVEANSDGSFRAYPVSSQDY